MGRGGSGRARTRLWRAAASATRPYAHGRPDAPAARPPRGPRGSARPPCPRSPSRGTSGARLRERAPHSRTARGRLACAACRPALTALCAYRPSGQVQAPARLPGPRIPAGPAPEPRASSPGPGTLSEEEQPRTFPQALGRLPGGLQSLPVKSAQAHVRSVEVTSPGHLKITPPNGSTEDLPDRPLAVIRCPVQSPPDFLTLQSQDSSKGLQEANSVGHRSAPPHPYSAIPSPS